MRRHEQRPMTKARARGRHSPPDTQPRRWGTHEEAQELLHFHSVRALEGPLLGSGWKIPLHLARDSRVRPYRLCPTVSAALVCTYVHHNVARKTQPPRHRKSVGGAGVGAVALGRPPLFLQGYPQPSPSSPPHLHQSRAGGGDPSAQVALLPFHPERLR